MSQEAENAFFAHDAAPGADLFLGLTVTLVDLPVEDLSRDHLDAGNARMLHEGTSLIDDVRNLSARVRVPTELDSIVALTAPTR